ncbi:spore protease YyaC [Jeotgalibacillus soli]|uniref:Sporulation protein YyaC n=1 Tax=Jeotgalibacillus soli TaxID=889306 RepID=A0A0C2VZ28_9BACL|nr:spore protease YyaC [Jeotgalibacillus soli]KIL49208.1 hypothetical protein KP78_06760 [Jeotgalibacillus soli]
MLPSMSHQYTPTTCRSHIEDPLTSHRLSKELVTRYPTDSCPIVFVCVGSDRSTGDSLGPLIGSNLQKRNLPHFHLYGTLKEPVHALNLEQTMTTIYEFYPDAFIIGIDACLGQYRNVGFIEVGDGPIRPGAGVNKKLPDVGNIHIMGIVNVGGFMEMAMLQNTRLYLVTEMASIITDIIHYSNILYRNKI